MEKEHRYEKSVDALGLQHEPLPYLNNF
jgi:hypothetical protein